MTTQISGTTGVSQVQPAVVVDASLNLTANSPAIKTALNASGNAPIYACRAWVNFNGTGSVAVRASGNVIGVTDNGVGDYTVSFTTSLPSVNFIPIVSLSGNYGVRQAGGTSINSTSGFVEVSPVVSSCRFITNDAGGNPFDPKYVNSAFF